jgi:Protein kinase domain
VKSDAFGRYNFLKDKKGEPFVLGHGAWGTVHKVFDNDLRCYAALRIIPSAAFAGAEARDRFVAEVRGASHIHHPSLAAVFPLESVEDKFLYAAELCDGETLAKRIAREGCLEPAAALNLVSQIASGLEVAASAGLFHRNLCAENIMLIQEDEEISVKVLDLALPAGGAAAEGGPHPRIDFSSPEEDSGNEISERSGVYSLCSLLVYSQEGPEKYALLRAKSFAHEGIVFDEAAGISPPLAEVLQSAFHHDPSARIATFAEFRAMLERVLSAPRRREVVAVASLPADAEPLESAEQVDRREPSGRAEEAGKPERVEAAEPIQTAEKDKVQRVDGADVTQDLPFESFRPGSIETTAPPRPVGFTIPKSLLGAAQPGSILRLQREGGTGEEIVACARNRFRVGRSVTAGADLSARFLPRSKENDTKTKKLSRIHVTAKREKDKILLFDGDSVTPSANGATFDGRALSIESPLNLSKSGELRLAEVFPIGVIPHTPEQDDTDPILNISEWNGPIHQPDLLKPGSVVFVPNVQSEIRVAVWLFTAAPFGSSKLSPLDFAQLAGGREIAALRYYGKCFWIEQRSPDSVAVDGLPLAPFEIAPLVTGQTLQVSGASYSIKVEDAAAEREG